MDAAPLKLKQSRDLGISSLETLRIRMDAAPLKQKPAGLVAGGRNRPPPHPHGCGPIEAEGYIESENTKDISLRIRMDAAPLKQDSDELVGVEYQSPPHPHGCGPIEALS